ncbi:hypothetical protein [Ornithinicoccus halotolerans]|uniref:hypothetical protein n=1 Tax=Ornithinicoccus halotolerans TaxID=1748220 RepID=UPI001295E7BF|nr:hypothetical protein [Ornithinicoccus halotolerans]
MRLLPGSKVQPGQLLLDERLAGVGMLWWRATHPSGLSALLVKVPGHGARQLVSPPGRPVLAGPPPCPRTQPERMLTAAACGAAWLYLRRGGESDRARAWELAVELTDRFGGDHEERWCWLLDQARETAPFPRWEDASQDTC